MDYIIQVRKGDGVLISFTTIMIVSSLNIILNCSIHLAFYFKLFHLAELYTCTLEQFMSFFHDTLKIENDLDLMPICGYGAPIPQHIRLGFVFNALKLIMFCVVTISIYYLNLRIVFLRKK